MPYKAVYMFEYINLLVKMTEENKIIEEEEPDFDITKYHKCLSDLYWHGCYDGDAYFKQYFEPSTYAHPAKISPLLADRIFKHLEKLELLKEGMTVLDFMAGSGRIPLMASLRGYKGLGVELEPHFVKMCNDNKKFAENKIGRKLDMEILQGDSRRLSKLLSKSDVAVVSPPFEQSRHYYGDKSDEFWEKKAELSKRPAWLNKDGKTRQTIERQEEGYGDNPSNIGNLKYKEMVGVVSPPYQDVNVEGGVHRFGLGNLEKHWSKSQPKDFQHNYSQNPENIGNLKDTSFVGITSPPFFNETGAGKEVYESLGKRWNALPSYERDKYKSSYGGDRLSEKAIKEREERIRTTDNIGSLNVFGNKGKDLSQNYLSAMLQVYKEASKVCPIICTVTKNPTRAGKLRRLDLDTAKLLELAGYTIVDYHRAVLFKTYEQSTLTGGTKKEHKGRLSFFKRLSLSKGNQASQWEDIIIGVRK